MNTLAEWFNNKIISPLKSQLTSGADPRGLALSIACGISGGLFPIPGTTTFICFLYIYILSVNPVICTTVNLLLTPVELALVVPFMKMGESLLAVFNTFDVMDSDRSASDSTTSNNVNAMNSTEVKFDIYELFNSPSSFASQFGSAIFHAILAWLVVSAVFIPLLTVALTPFFKAFFKKKD